MVLIIIIINFIYTALYKIDLQSAAHGKIKIKQFSTTELRLEKDHGDGKVRKRLFSWLKEATLPAGRKQRQIPVSKAQHLV